MLYIKMEHLDQTYYEKSTLVSSCDYSAVTALPRTTATELALPYAHTVRLASVLTHDPGLVLARGRSVIKAPRHDRSGHAGWRPRNIWRGGQGL